MRAKPLFRQHFIFKLFTFVPTVLREASRTFFVFRFFGLLIFPSRVLWVLDFCRVHEPQFWHQLLPNLNFPSCSKSLRSPENPCPKHTNVRVPRAIDHESIHAQTIITFVFQVHTLTRESMAQTIIPLLFQEHTVTRASMPKP